MQLKKRISQAVIYFVLSGLSLSAAKAEYYYDMPGDDVPVVARALQDLENDVTPGLNPVEKEIVLKEVYEAIERDQEASFRNKFRLLDIYAELIKEHNISQEDAIAMFQGNDPRFYKIYNRIRKELLLESISRIRDSSHYLRVERVWSEVTNKKNLKLLGFFKEVACKIPPRSVDAKLDQETINEVLKKAIDRESAAMAEDQKKLQVAKDKLRSQLKDVMDKIIKNKNTKHIEAIIIKNYGVTQEEAKAIILSHDDRAYTVLQDLILNGEK
jgi:hypothetical protein